MSEGLTEKELTYLNSLRKFENKWVAILESEDQEIAVGSGNDAVGAQQDAAAKGFNEVSLNHKPYLEDVEYAFGADIDYAMLLRFTATNKKMQPRAILQPNAWTA